MTGTPSDGEDGSKQARLAPLNENLQPDEEDWRNKVKLKHLNDEEFSIRVIEMLESHQQMWRPGYLCHTVKIGNFPAMTVCQTLVTPTEPRHCCRSTACQTRVPR